MKIKIKDLKTEQYIRKLIKEQLIKEYNSEDSFLSDYESATQYAIENINDVEETFEDYKENPENIQASYSRDNYIERIEQYVDKYHQLRLAEEVEIYRLIKLNSIKDLNINEIGKHWSFEEEGVGAYGEQHPNIAMMRNGKPFVLTANVSPSDIDWVYGFHSFIWYGSDQWECALLKGTTVEITKINDKELDKPIKAKVGKY